MKYYVPLTMEEPPATICANLGKFVNSSKVDTFSLIDFSCEEREEDVAFLLKKNRETYKHAYTSHSQHSYLEYSVIDKTKRQPRYVTVIRRQLTI